MTYQTNPQNDVHKIIQALAPKTRWDIFMRLANHPLSVGEIAKIMPVSRPAVSQHLKVLKEVGLVHETAKGVQNIYHTTPQSLSILRNWCDHFWDHSLDNMKDLMEQDTGDQHD